MNDHYGDTAGTERQCVESRHPVDVESKRLGKTPDTLEHADLNAMSDNLVSALHLVVGQEVAEVAAQKVLELS